MHRGFIRFSLALLLLLPFLSGCSLDEKQRLERKIDKQCFRIKHLLQNVESAEDFQEIAAKFRMEMLSLVQLMSREKAIVERYGSLAESVGGIELEKEIIRLYSLPGMDEIINRYQQEPLNLLDKELLNPS